MHTTIITIPSVPTVKMDLWTWKDIVGNFAIVATIGLFSAGMYVRGNVHIV